MRICEVTRVYSTHRFGGIPVRAKLFSEIMVQNGHDVVVLTTSLKDGKQGYDEINGVKIYYLDCPSMVYSDKWWKESNEMFNKLNKEYSFDFIHSESYAGAEIETTIPKIATVHGANYGLIETYALMLKNKIDVDLGIAVSEYLRDYCKFVKFDKLVAVSNKEFRVLKQKYLYDRVELVYNPVSSVFFNRNWEGDGDYFFCCGILSEFKGSNVIRMLSEKIRILYAGDKNPGGNVEYLGVLSHEDIVNYLVHCKGFINPTLYCKGFDLTTCEAMAVGVPCFVSYIQVDEDLKDKENCIFIDPYDSNLCLKIVSVSQDKNLCKHVSRNAKFFASENFYHKVFVDNFLKML